MVTLLNVYNNSVKIMIHENPNQQSAVTLKRKDLDYDDFIPQKNQQQFDQIDPYTPIPRSSKRYTFVNPFAFNQSPQKSDQEEFHFQNIHSNIIKNQSKERISKSSFPNKNESFQFPRKSKVEFQNQQNEFMFNGDFSGSLFSSQKSQQNRQNDNRFKNLQNYKKLLKEHYNESYMKNNFRLIRRSTLGKSIRGSDMANIITRQPILFHKKFYGSRSGYDLSGNFLCRLVGNKIYFKNVLSEELQNTDEIKCQFIQLPQSQSISPSMEIESSSMHLFYYSNTTNQIVVISLSKAQKNNNNEICRIKSRTQRRNPLLSLIQINKQVILLLIGGYTPINPKFNPQDVQGCKFIEIFPVDKWGTAIMDSRVIKLINGKIYPLVIFPIKIQNNQSLLLIGGNTMAKITGNKLSFKEYKTLNRSSNVRAVYINTKQIIECIQQSKDIMSLPNANNISVQIEDKVKLYKGYVDYVRSSQKEKIRIFLPKMKEFYTLKLLKKQLRIIKSNDSQQRMLTFDSNDQYHHLEMKCFKKPMTKYYEINNKGIFQQKIIQLSNLNFKIKKQCRCPCQFM